VEKLEPQDPWHYPRPKLAEKYLKVFDIGLIAAHGLFAKRRMGSEAALQYTLDHVLSDSNFLPVFNRLLPADQGILKLLANGESDVFSEGARRRMGEAMGTGQAVTKSSSSNALKRLCRQVRA
jgi:hypothetical protein